MSRAVTSDGVVLGFVCAMAYAVKSYYSTAGADDLRWALDPTTYLVEHATGLRFAFERGAGFVSGSRRLVIAPACAGVNFFVIALLSLSFGFVPALRTKAHKVAFVAAAALSAYVTMLVVNAARISLHVLVSSHVHWADGYREQAHRVEGVVTYLTALFVLMATARACLERAPR
ncbi:MAG TPA: exosortase K [Polyangiaceae bacterium]|nr:exosortase K [Polyangiaceae bacterium]